MAEASSYSVVAVDSGGSVDRLTVADGGEAFINGTVHSLHVNSGGFVDVSGGGVMKGAMI